MSKIQTNVSREGRDIQIRVEGLDSLYDALGDLKSKAPAAAKVAINATAREARKRMIAAAKARYAVNAAGLRHLKELKQQKRATNTSLWALLHIETPRDDLAYFQNEPNKVFSGGSALTSAPEYVRARVLKASPMTLLSGSSTRSKGFLAKFKSGHIGMVQRMIGSHSDHTTTENGAARWRGKGGRVEKLVTMGAASASAMHGKVWAEVEDEVAEYLEWRLGERVKQIMECARSGGIK